MPESLCSISIFRKKNTVCNAKKLQSKLDLYHNYIGKPNIAIFWEVNIHYRPIRIAIVFTFNANKTLCTGVSKLVSKVKLLYVNNTVDLILSR